MIKIKALEDKKKYPYEEMEEVALEVVKQLKPFCSRIAITGSIRRKKADIGDIDICLILKPDEIGKFQEGIAKVINQWVKIKGSLPCKYTQRLLPDGKKLDIYFATEQNWGNLVAIRTGDLNYSKFLAKRWVKLGYSSIDGFLTKEGERIEIKEEKDLFKLLYLEYVNPEDRN